MLCVQLDSVLMEKLKFYSLKYLEKLSLMEMFSHVEVFMLFQNYPSAYHMTITISIKNSFGLVSITFSTDVMFTRTPECFAFLQLRYSANSVQH